MKYILLLRLTYTLQIKVKSATASRTPATYECCPNEVYPRIDLNFKFQYVQRMEGMKILTPETENEVDDD